MGDVHVEGFDHLVLVCAEVERTLAWYVEELGLEPVRVEEWRRGEVFFPSVRVSAETIIDLIPGTVSGRNVDHLCLVADQASVDHVVSSGRFTVVDGPDQRFGARGMATSVYVTDPDGTTVELRAYPTP